MKEPRAKKNKIICKGKSDFGNLMINGLKSETVYEKLIAENINLHN